MNKVMITIGRQFGSGGHKIGEYLSNRLGISYYDNELILLAAQRGDLKVEHIQEMDEMIQNPFLYEKQETVVEDTMEETVFELQQEVIRQLAEKETAVFVGRCADEALRKAGYRVLSIFISAPLKQRIARTCRLQGILGTGGNKAAAGGSQGRNRFAVEPDQKQKDRLHSLSSLGTRIPSFFICWRKLRSTPLSGVKR